MRRHPPALVVPGDVVSDATIRQFGVPTTRNLMRRLSVLEREVATRLRSGDAAAPTVPEILEQLGLLGDPLLNIDFSFAQPIGSSTVKGTVTATSITSTTGTTVVNFNLGPLVANVPYLVKADALLASNADPAGFIISLARIGASGASIEGMRTGTASGERSLRAVAYGLVWGTGETVNISGRAKTTTGTSSVNDASVSGDAWPLNMMAFR